jgi:hypothetical protein
MSVTELAADIVRRMHAAEIPSQWGAVLIRLTVLRSRLPVPPPGLRHRGTYRIAVAKLIGSAREREAAMGAFHDEVMAVVLDIGAVARIGVGYGNPTPSEPSALPNV